MEQQRTCEQNIFSSLLILLAIGVLLLQACSNETAHQTGRNAALGMTPTPAIGLFLQQRGKIALQAFQQWIMLLEQNGGDIVTYQQQYSSAQQAFKQTKTVTQYTTVLQTLQAQTQAIKLPAMKQEVQYLQQQLQQQVSIWGEQHQFHDSYDGQTYSQDYAYDKQHGIGGPLWLQEELDTEQTLADYQQTIKDLSIWLYHFHEMAANFEEKTPSNQVHTTDIDLLQHYRFMNERVVIVSLSEQALRAYDHGKLVKAFLVTTGQPGLPTPPGVWRIEGKQHPTVFKSSAPQGSPE